VDWSTSSSKKKMLQNTDICLSEINFNSNFGRGMGLVIFIIVFGRRDKFESQSGPYFGERNFSWLDESGHL
jgi:hypothetical protein